MNLVNQPQNRKYILLNNINKRSNLKVINKAISFNQIKVISNNWI
jgi:hypothetical protein